LTEPTTERDRIKERERGKTTLRWSARYQKFADSSLEGTGFELPVRERTVRWHRATDLPLPPTAKRRSAGRPPPMARPRNAACSAAHQLSAFAIGQPVGTAERLRARDLAESWQSLLGAAHIRVSSKPELKERLLAFIGDINREPVESRGGIGSHRFGPAPVALSPRGTGECDRQ
jgi:hypothetical protein